MKFRDHQDNTEHTIALVEECYKAHLHKVVYFANSYLCDIVASHDIASEVFTTVWENRSTIDFSIEILPYLMTLTKNNCLNRLKRMKIEERYKSVTRQNSEKIYLNYRSLSEISNLKIFSREIETILYDTLEKMPVKIKNTFILSMFRNMKYYEIAEELDISKKTVEKRIAEALRILRVSLKDYLPK